MKSKAVKRRESDLPANEPEHNSPAFRAVQTDVYRRPAPAGPSAVEFRESITGAIQSGRADGAGTTENDGTMNSAVRRADG